MNFPATIEDFYNNLAIPESCYLGKRLFKKLFHENSQLSATDRKAFKEDIESIEWKYTLKPSTINIPSFEDDAHEYLEVALLHVNLSSDKRHSRIAEVIQKAIPYPVIIVLSYSSSIAISVAMKRINRADSNKMVVEAHLETGWISLESPEGWQRDFFDDFLIKNLSFQNFFLFYEDIAKRITAYNCATYTGAYILNIPKQGMHIEREEALRKLENLERELSMLRNKLKKEKNLGNQVILNTKSKQIKDRIEAIRTKI